MSQRGSGYARQPNELYVTPKWVTEALLEFLPRPTKILEPAAGPGQMAGVLRRRFGPVVTADLDRGENFLEMQQLPLGVGGIVTNPPYNQAEEFCEHALKLTLPVKGFVAMLLRCDFDHAKRRFGLFRDCSSFARKVVLTRRIVWFVEADGKPKGSPSFNHAWYIWDHKHVGPPTIAYAHAEPEQIDLEEAIAAA
jgi:hypothetical protein